MNWPSEPLYLVLEGHKRVLRPDAFANALQAFVKLLRELDAALSHDPRGTVVWEIATLRKDSPAIIGFSANPRKRREPIQDVRTQIARDCVGGLDLLSKKPERLRTYSDRALDRTEYLAKLRSNDRFDDMRVMSGGADASVGVATLANIQTIKGPTYESAGSVIGMLEAITVHNAYEFRVWSESTGKPVTCRFDEAIFDTVRASLKKKVVVFGHVKWNVLGHPISITVEGVEPVEAQRELTIDEVSGAVEDFTGDLTLEQYLEELRNG